MVIVELFHRFTVPQQRTAASRGIRCDGGDATTPPSRNGNNHDNDETRILAFSTSQRNSDGSRFPRALCADRRGFLDHLRPKIFLKNGFRIAIMQSTTVITNYYNDQLKYDIEREERVLHGKITRQEADREEAEWQETEWTLRLESIPRRIYVTFLKYHAIVFVMRLYEHVASKYVTEETLDTLTIDTFECAKRTTKTEDRGQLLSSMWTTCWKANTISFLADYSVHQLILAYGYIIYIKEKRRQIKQGNNEDLKIGSLALSFVQKSSLLAFSRGVSLCFSSVGGAIGTTFWPGWGTLAGTNLGDSLSQSLINDVRSPTID